MQRATLPRRPCHRGLVALIGIGLLATTACTASSAGHVTPSAPVSSAAPASSAPASESAPASAASAAASVASGPYGTDPLTGLPAGSAQAATRPALAIKVDNVAGAWPQAGLNQADIVFDIPVEGGLTRLLALFHSDDVPLVGPIRSTRPVDADLLHLFGRPYFAFAGGTKSDLAPIIDHSKAVVLSWAIMPGPFLTRHDHPIPHQVFAATQSLYAAGQAISASTTPPPPIFSYASAAPAGSPASSVTAPFDSATALWTWNGSAYLRTQNGHPDLLVDSSQVSTTNVVVISVNVVPTAARDAHGSVVPFPVVVGSGAAWVFRNGVEVQGTWSRPSEGAPMRLTTSAGAAIDLAPGRTWVEILPNSRVPRVG